MEGKLKLSDFFPGISKTETPYDYMGYLIESKLIAYDSKTGKMLFNTGLSKVNYRKIKKYLNATVIKMWSNVKTRGKAFNTYIEPVIECYLLHDSWESDNK